MKFHGMAGIPPYMSSMWVTNGGDGVRKRTNHASNNG